MEGLAPCITCTHYKEYGSCDAFEVIPDEIWWGLNRHREPVDGDGGILYEPRPDAWKLEKDALPQEAYVDTSLPMTESGRWVTVEGERVWVEDMTEAEDLPPGKWRTIDGHKVFIPDDPELAKKALSEHYAQFEKEGGEEGRGGEGHRRGESRGKGEE